MNIFHLLIISMLISPFACDAKVKNGSNHSYTPPYIHTNNIPPRIQWETNFGYCGETCMIMAGLYYGQYISQYTARAIASKNTPQNLRGSELLLGVNDKYAATQMHLNAIEWNTDAETDTPQFLAWIKKNVIKNYPVAIGLYTNEYLFYNNSHPDAGDPDYDHIVVITGIGSNHPLTDTQYYADDTLYFSDNGLWTGPQFPHLYFHYLFAPFQANREQANAKNGQVYSLTNDGSNYGIAITGVMDLNGDTLPVRLTTNLNDEKPPIEHGSNTPPPPESLVLTITVSNLTPNVSYILYRYNDMGSVPNSNFNANAGKASQKWPIKIRSGTSFSLQQTILSNEIAVYRAVKANAP